MLKWLPRVLVVWLASLAVGEALSQGTAPVLGRRPSADLATEVSNAAGDQLYAVHLGFSQPTSVGEIRTVSAQLGIPRVLAYVEYEYSAGGGRGRGLVILGLGEMYATADARQYSECRAHIMVNLGQNELRDSPIDEWPVSKIHLYGTAHLIRELSAGKLLPPTTILDGSAAEPEHLRKVEGYVRTEMSQPIVKPSSIELPAHCEKFVGPLDAPVLTGELPPAAQQPDFPESATFRERAFRILGQLPMNTAVTITLKLNFPATVEALAALVQEYEIRGMQAELVPQRSSKRMIADAQLSTYGAEPNAQVHRVRCQMRLGAGRVQASGEWYADWISVSLSTEAAVRFLSYPGLAQATVAGSYPIGDLERLRGYYDRLATRVYEMPKSMEIPPDCGDVYVHGDYDEPGSLVMRPE